MGNAITTREPADVGSLSEPSIRKLLDVRQLDELHRFQTSVVVHPVHQYAIPRRFKDDDGKWKTGRTVMITSDGYDYLNRVMGVQIVQPEWVHDEQGNRVPNPIHRKDYIYVRVLGIWRNDVGQMISYREDIEVDFQKVYHDARLNAVWYTGSGSDRTKHEPEVVFAHDKEGNQKFDENGIPVFTVKLPPDQELAAAKKLSQLRTFGLRYAQTVAKTRILKTASGIRTLPLNDVAPVQVSIVGWRDLLSPEQREEEARRTANTVWGAPIGEGSGLSDMEMETANVDVTVDPEIERLIDAPKADADDEDGLPDMPEWAGGSEPDAKRD